MTEAPTLSSARTPARLRLHDGGAPARARAAAVDKALAALAAEVLGSTPPVAVIAVGGYGRGELSPLSDVDLLFLHPSVRGVNQATLRGMLYPLWDAGFQVGHALRTPKEAAEAAADDLDAATSLLSARFIAGDRAPFEELIDRRGRWLARHGKQLARRILTSLADRHATAERAGWALAPDLKDGVGGLRDLHAGRWLSVIAGDAPEDRRLVAAGELLLAVREALHAEVRRKTDRVRIDLQSKIASRLGLDQTDGADEVMTKVHSAARRIEHLGEIAREALAENILGGPKRTGSVIAVSEGIRVEDGALTVSGPATPERALRLLAARSSTGRPLSTSAFRWLEDSFRAGTARPWTEAMRAAFVDVLAGPHAASALELLDHAGGWQVLMPEWKGVRGRAQHDPYHRYTVDGHSFLAVEETTRALAEGGLVATAAEEARRPEVLYTAALLHDIGKGSGENHSIAGERLARSACERMGMTREQIEEVAALVRWHLLLPDTATRRDLDDGGVIDQVARTIGDPIRLRMLLVLAVADGRATGPEAWSRWKADLVFDLYRKALIALETGALPTRSDARARAEEVEAYEPALVGRAEDVLNTLPPSYLESTAVEELADEIRLLLDPPAPGQVRHRFDHGVETGQAALTVCVADRPGTLARTAGVLALNRVSVLRAQAYSTTTGLALERFVIDVPTDVSWDEIAAGLEAAYSGHLAVEARLDRKVRDYARGAVPEPEVRILHDESPHSTVVEVRCRDALGLLYALAAGFSDLDLDIHIAKIDTLGARVVDVFYVRSVSGSKLTGEQGAEVERSIRHRLNRLYG